MERNTHKSYMLLLSLTLSASDSQAEGESTNHMLEYDRLAALKIAEDTLLWAFK